MAHLTNFSFEFFYEIFTEGASLLSSIPWCKKVKSGQKLKSGGPAFRQDPLDLSFWLFFTFLHHVIEESREAPSVKISKNNSKEKLVKCATEVARLHMVSIQSCTQNQPSPKVQSRSQDWIELFYSLDYLYKIWHTCSACSWLQKKPQIF